MEPLYVAETMNGRLWSWDIESPGVFKPGTTPYAPGNLHYDFEGFQLLDSMAVDSEGNVCVATLVTGAISVVSPEGKLIDQIKVPKYDVFVTNICFGGPDMRTAYITSSGLGLLVHDGVAAARPAAQLQRVAIGLTRSHRGVPGPMGVLISPPHSSQGCGFWA